MKQVSHGDGPDAGDDPAGFALALDVARALHPPVARAPEVAAAAPAAVRPARRGSARRRTVRG
ncbi:hypothetical protein G5C60_43870 [Streptomyces sp. HC44]|uniref:Uncharacterized protein n=1 Tax=Streptomyces scabichelini TaxID=2711217 RepID=A0A6G4VKN4_9ACTN|nr:hypothetical protein [Streptomyces scabichelini]